MLKDLHASMTPQNIILKSFFLFFIFLSCVHIPQKAIKSINFHCFPSHSYPLGILMAETFLPLNTQKMKIICLEFYVSFNSIQFNQAKLQIFTFIKHTQNG